MPVTTTADLPNAVVVKYERDYIIEAYGEEVWNQYVDWEVMQEGASGSAWDFPGFAEMDPQITPLAEDTDVIPVKMVDDHLVVTPFMFGNATVKSEEARFRARADLREADAKLLAQNRNYSVERIVRNAVLGGSNVFRQNGVALRTDLDTTSDLVTYAYLVNLHAIAMANDIEPIGPDGLFVCPISELLAANIKQLTEFKEVQYRRPVNLQNQEIYGGMQPFIFGGFHFIPHKWGKLYQSGGTLAQAATTLASPAAAGDTTVTVTSATGLSAGDYITLGTLEGTYSETVQIVSIASTVIFTIRGKGNKATNLGLRYSHAALEAVTEADFVAAIPVIGANSIKGVYAANTGRFGQPVLTQGIDILQRFIYQGWKAHFGVNVWDRYVLRGECAVSFKTWIVD